MPDLTSLATLKAYLGVSGTGDDALLTRLVTAASGAVQSYVSQPILSQSVTETRDGSGTAALAFACTPVSALAAVTLDGVAMPAAPDEATYGFRFTPTVLLLNGAVFTRGRANVTLSYTAGFSTVPPDIEQATIVLAATQYEERKRLGQGSRSLGGESVSFVKGGMPPSVVEALAAYRRVVPL